MTTCETCAREAIAVADYGTGPMHLCVRCAWRAVAASGGIVTAIVTHPDRAGGRLDPIHPVVRAFSRELVGIVDQVSNGRYSAIIGTRQKIRAGHGPQWIVGRSGPADTGPDALRAACQDRDRALTVRAGELARVDALDRAGEHDRARALLPTCAACGHSEYEHGPDTGPCADCACRAFT